MKLLQTFVLLGLASAAFAVPSLDSAVLKTIGTGKTANILISFTTNNATVAAIRAQALLRAPSSSARGIRGQLIYSALKAHADSSQANVMNMLKKEKSADAARSDMVVRSFWITNQIGIKGADLDLISSLLSMEEISGIEEAQTVSLVQPTSFETLPSNYVHAAAGDEQWGVAAIEAPAVWAEGDRGEGVVIANIDTGVYGEHEALVGGYRAQNGWFDPTENFPSPNDGNGHGTHTMGTILGRVNGIGVAPGAQWISCKGLFSWGGGDMVDLIACGQFMLCPTESDGVSNPRCDLAPHAVSNSWGGTGGNSQYDEVIRTWVAAGIAPIFAAGNQGHDECSTAHSPGDSLQAITIGGTDEREALAVFSSVGPTLSGLLKPDVVAPGVNIISACIGGPIAYCTSSGTSMATPHAAGLTALLYNKRPNLGAEEVRRLLQAGAQRSVKPTCQTCGGISDESFPNNHAGHGRISARASVDELIRLYNN